MKASVYSYGERSVLIELADTNPTAYLSSLRKTYPTAEIRSGLQSLVITFDEIADHTESVKVALESIQPNSEETHGKTLIIDVEYDGADLSDVCNALGISKTQLVSFHTAITWQVALIGFAPGFPYLVPTNLNQKEAKLLSQLERLAIPRTKVPAGSVALATGMCCVYPSSMPGGWNLIGTTEEKLFDSNNSNQPALLQVGDLVQFREVNS
jgi:hypothetical protein